MKMKSEVQIMRILPYRLQRVTLRLSTSDCVLRAVHH